MRLEFSPGPRNVVCDLVEKRVAWTIRLADLEQEYAVAVLAIERLDAMLGRGHGTQPRAHDEAATDDRS